MPAAGAWVGVDSSRAMLARALPRRALTCDAESAPGLVGALFDDVEVAPWDAPLLELPTESAVRDYIVGKGGDPGRAQAAAAAVGDHEARAEETAGRARIMRACRGAAGLLSLRPCVDVDARPPAPTAAASVT